MPPTDANCDAPLSRLRAGEFAVISDIDGAQPGAKRLVDMGFVRGSLVTMVRPGRTCLVRLGDRCIGLGRRFQEIIRLERAFLQYPST